MADVFDELTWKYGDGFNVLSGGLIEHIVPSAASMCEIDTID